MIRTFRPAGGAFGAPAALAAVAALSLGLAGCKVDDRPLLAWGRPAPPAPYAGAPVPGPLDPTYAPPAATPALAAYPPPVRAYAYPQRAYLISRAAYDAPPSYAFGYGGEQPWAWDVPDEGTMFAEPVDDGWRYYYYDPGEPYPYFVQDPDYGYAYGDGGVLIALFDAGGALLSGPQYAPIEYRARDYWRRGHDLDEAYARSPRYRVDERAWRERAPSIVQPQARWFQAASAQPAWRQAAAAGAGRASTPDRGRHLGWRGDHDRQIALAAPPPALPQQRPGREAHAPQAWRGGERPPPPRAPHAGPPQPWREARQAHAPPPAPFAHAPQGRPGGERRGPPAFAMADQPHGGPPAWHAPPPAAPSQPRPGGGGPHAPAGGPHGDPGGGHGGGHGGGQHGQDRDHR